MAVKVEKWVVNRCEECTHIVYDTDSREAVIVDCGRVMRFFLISGSSSLPGIR